MPAHFQLFLYHLHHINHTIFLFYVLHHPLLFNLFNIAPNILIIILISLIAIILILILILFIHLTTSPSNHVLVPKHILTSTENLTPNFLISATLSRLWDRSVLLDTYFFFFIFFIVSFLSALFCFFSDTPIFFWFCFL